MASIGIEVSTILYGQQCSCILFDGVSMFRDIVYLTVASFVNQSTRIPHVFPEVSATITNTPFIKIAKSLHFHQPSSQ
jgi:hypothetical protein